MTKHHNYLTEEEEAGLMIDAFSSKANTVSEDDTCAEADDWAAQMIGTDDFPPDKKAPPITVSKAIELLEHQRNTLLKKLYVVQARVYTYEEALRLLRRIK